MSDGLAQPMHQRAQTSAATNTNPHDNQHERMQRGGMEKARELYW